MSATPAGTLDQGPSTPKVWVLLRWRDGDMPGKVLGVYPSYEDVERRVARIAKANSQYPMRQHGRGSWTVGPEEDEGFFGHKPVHLSAQEAPHYGEGAGPGIAVDVATAGDP